MLRVSSIHDFDTTQVLRNVRSVPHVKMIVIQLGINDLRDTRVTPRNLARKLESAVEKLRQSTSCPIFICRLCPVINNRHLNNKVIEFNNLLFDYESDCKRRNSRSNIQTIKNSIFWRGDQELAPLYRERDSDGVHLSSRGVSLLASNIKFAIANWCGIRIARNSRSHDSLSHNRLSIASWNIESITEGKTKELKSGMPDFTDIIYKVTMLCVCRRR